MDKTKTYDFGGWATKNDLRCADGRVIIKDAFKHNDGKTVPLVWNHGHNDPFNVVGHAVLENRDTGVYAYGYFNNTDAAKHMKQSVVHGDITQLSILASRLKEEGHNVIHGNINELSLVLAGANPGACIETIISHGEYVDDAAIIYTGEDFSLSHSEPTEQEKSATPEEPEKSKAKTVAEVYNEMNLEQQNVVCAIVDETLKTMDTQSDDKGENNMKHNLFDKTQNENTPDPILSHADMATIFNDAKRFGSLKESAFAHSETNGTAFVYTNPNENSLAHGIEHIDYLFPEMKVINSTPEFIKRDTGWVAKVMNSVHRTPFSRIKSVFADLTEDDARAKGYIKGKMKKDEVFTLLKRTTTPTTVYKKQKMERDDVIDIVDMNVVAWIKSEMRMMLDEEIARAILVGDDRSSSSDDKINEMNIRPIWKDDDLFTIKTQISLTNPTSSSARAKAFIKSAIKSRSQYKGSGQPTLYVTEDVLTDCLLLEDNNGRMIYDSVTKLATAMRVKEIVTVAVMENLQRTIGQNGSEQVVDLMGIIVNLQDYNVGADKGGAIQMFDDFDIDYNALKYLIETRCSGALTQPYSAIAIEIEMHQTAATSAASTNA